MPLTARESKQGLLNNQFFYPTTIKEEGNANINANNPINT